MSDITPEMLNSENKASRVNGNININCDQVSWMLDIFNRYLPKSNHPSISREREMKKYAALYETMEILGLKFEDEKARWNGTPNDARPYSDEDIPNITSENKE